MRVFPCFPHCLAPFAQVPKLIHSDPVVAAHPRRTYANAHAYHINSLSVNSDGMTYISADDLRINLWHSDISDKRYMGDMGGMGGMGDMGC